MSKLGRANYVAVSENAEERAVWGECQNSEELTTWQFQRMQKGGRFGESVKTQKSESVLTLCCPFGVALRRRLVL